METSRYVINEDAQVAFSLMHFWASAGKLILFLGGFVAAMAAAAWATGNISDIGPVLVGGLVGIVLWLAILRFAIVPHYAKRAWREFALIKEPVELSLAEHSFHLVQPSASVEAEWNHMLAWNENAHVFAIYVTRQQAYILPKDQVSSEHIDYARGRLIDSGLPQKRKRRK